MKYSLPFGPDPDAELMLRLKHGEDLMTRWQQPRVAFIHRYVGHQADALNGIGKQPRSQTKAMKLGVLVICFLAPGVAVLAQESMSKTKQTKAGRLTLIETVTTALQNNPSIKTARAKWESAKQRIPQAAAWEDPKLSVNSLLGRFVDISRNGFADQMVTVEQMIPLSGKNRSKERIAAAEAVASFEDFRRQQLDVVWKTKASYFRLANLYLLLDLNDQDEAALSQTLDASKAKFEVGTQSQADYLTAEVERQKVAETRRDLEEKLSDEQTKLKVLLNQDPFSPLGRPVSSEALPLVLSQERLRRLTLENRPEVRQAQTMVIGASAKVELAKRAWVPDPSVNLQAQHYNAGSQAVSELNAGVSIDLPWFNPKKYRAGEREAESDFLAAQRTLEAAQTEAIGMLRDQLQKIETLHHHIELYRDKLLPSARQTVSSYQADYETDKTTLIQVLSSENSLRQLETMYNQDLTDYRVAIAELESLVGADLNVADRNQQSSYHGKK
jgi:outer membrane protein, heavy metal efflux system